MATGGEGVLRLGQRREVRARSCAHSPRQRSRGSFIDLRRALGGSATRWTLISGGLAKGGPVTTTRYSSTCWEERGDKTPSGRGRREYCTGTWATGTAPDRGEHTPGNCGRCAGSGAAPLWLASGRQMTLSVFAAHCAYRGVRRPRAAALDEPPGADPRRARRPERRRVPDTAAVRAPLPSRDPTEQAGDW